MWINFQSRDKFAVKIYVGGVNAVSGEPSTDTEQTRARRYKLLSERKSIQDYIVTPKQLWLDGIASQDGTVRQFVAMPLGSGYSVEAQITGADLIGGLQLEVVPAKEILSASFIAPIPLVMVKPAGTPHFNVYVKTLTGKTITLVISELHTVYEMKHLIQDRGGIPPDQQRLVYEGQQLEDRHKITKYAISSESDVHLVLRLRGGGDPTVEMGIAAGGLIKQTIKKDRNDPTIWETDKGTIFNIQILNSAAFTAVTGEAPPKTPISAETYAAHGYPYYDIYDEKTSGIEGDFSGVQSVAEKDLQGSAARPDRWAHWLPPCQGHGRATHREVRQAGIQLASVLFHCETRVANSVQDVSTTAGYMVPTVHASALDRAVSRGTQCNTTVHFR
jgi:hypothetical protein